METSVNVRQIKTFETKSGNTGYVLVDEKGNDYTTFDPRSGGVHRERRGSLPGSATARRNAADSAPSISMP